MFGNNVSENFPKPLTIQPRSQFDLNNHSGTFTIEMRQNIRTDGVQLHFECVAPVVSEPPSVQETGANLTSSLAVLCNWLLLTTFSPQDNHSNPESCILLGSSACLGCLTRSLQTRDIPGAALHLERCSGNGYDTSELLQKVRTSFAGTTVLGSL